MMMPANVRAGQVVSLVEVTGGLGPKIDTHRLADELGADIAVFLPILDAAELLGLVKKERGEVSSPSSASDSRRPARTKFVSSRTSSRRLSRSRPPWSSLQGMSR